MNLPHNPIFIVGYPRSGTTLLQRLLVTQSCLYSFPESHFFNVIEKAIRTDGGGNILHTCLDQVFSKIVEKMECQFSPAETTMLYQMAMDHVLSIKWLFEFIVFRFLRQSHPEIQDIPTFRWVEKTPNHAHFLKRIIVLYPRMQVLHILRHPVPAVFSRKLKFPFNKETPLAHLAQRWVLLQQDVELFKNLYPKHIYSLRYEDLVANVPKEMAAVSSFLQIPWEGATLSSLPHHPGADSLILPSEPWKLKDLNRHITNTNPDYKERFSPDEIRIIEDITGETMSQYGYHHYSE